MKPNNIDQESSSKNIKTPQDPQMSTPNKNRPMKMVKSSPSLSMSSNSESSTKSGQLCSRGDRNNSEIRL